MSAQYFQPGQPTHRQPAPQVNQMEAIKEINPRLMEAAMEQLQMLNQPEMSSTDSITITINKREPDPVTYNGEAQQLQNAAVYSDALNDHVQSRAGSILKDALGRPMGDYDFRQSSCGNPIRKMMY